MKPTKVEEKSVDAKTKQAVPLPPPSLPPLEKIWVLKPSTESITKQEIARFWKQKGVDEEDHLLAAIKAAARIRACNLLEDYKKFEESLKDEDFDAPEKDVPATTDSQKEKNSNEVHMGVKDGGQGATMHT